MTSQEYADLLIAESKKPASERKFTIANVPVKMRGEVGHLLRKAYGGNESDKRLGQTVQVVANAIPATAAVITAMPAASIVVHPTTKKFILDAILGFLGGKVVDEFTNDLSKGKYKTFGDYVYNASGLSYLTKGTKMEGFGQAVADLTNPGYYTTFFAKPIASVTAEIASRIKPGPTTIKYRYTRQNVKDAVKDLMNYLHTDRSTEPAFFKTARETGEKQMARNTPAYVTENGTLVDFPDRPVYKNAENTAAITKLDDNTYSLRLSPEQGKTLSLKERKEVLNWVNDLPRHSYISGDYSTLPQGQVFTNMLNEGDFGAFVKNYIWPSSGPRLNTSGMSPDAYETVAKLAKRPGYELRYMPEPMLSFNPLGAHGKNKAIYDGWVSSLTSSPESKRVFINSELNPWLRDLGVEQMAYLDMQNNIVMPHIGVYKNENGGKIKKAE